MENYDQIDYAARCFLIVDAHRDNEKALLMWIYGIEKRIVTVWGYIDGFVVDYIAKRRDRDLMED
jgi:hypothetical protein